MKKKVVLSGYFGFKNFGDELILSILIKKLRELNAEVNVITANPDYTRSSYTDIDCIKTFDLCSIIKKIKSCDILISGGGSLLQDVTSLKSLFYYLFIICIALIFKKQVIIFAQGIGPINNPLGRYVTRNILKHCKYISVRDEESAQLLKRWGIDSKIVCDPVFSLKIDNQPKDKILGFQLRNFKGVDDYYLDLLTSFCSLLPSYRIEIYSMQDSIDLDVCKKFKQKLELKNISVDLFHNLEPVDVINHISHCEYLIGMRFHSLIIGLLSGIKCLAINYDIKVEKLAKEFGLPYINLDGQYVNLKSKGENFIDQDLEKIKQSISKKEFDWSEFEKFF